MTKFWPWVYGFQSGDFIKVGIANNVEARLQQAKLFNPHPVKIVFRERHPEARRVEIEMHKILASNAIGREWFDIPVKAVRLAYNVACDRVAEYEDERDRWIAASLEKEAKRVQRVE